MSVGGSIINTLAGFVQSRTPSRQNKPISRRLRAGRQNLQEVFEARAAHLDMALRDLSFESNAARELQVHDARTLAAARDVLDMPVHGPVDLFAKYDTIMLFEEYYLERPNLIQSVLRHMRQDAQTVMNVVTSVESSGSGNTSGEPANNV